MDIKCDIHKKEELNESLSKQCKLCGTSLSGKKDRKRHFCSPRCSMIYSLIRKNLNELKQKQYEYTAYL
ncbi:MAG: hypothetical protein JSW73_05280 [Candidatus Woesearchaeota archaeon]|nr:MAG: hypothetical protein JSW73_05280 [Candidatus Woesearchaeota archaeon]